MTPLSGSLSSSDVQRLVYIGVGLFVLIVFVVASRVIAQFISRQLHQRHVQSDMVVLGRRVVYVVVIGVGLLGALSFATQTANVTLFGILIATIVTALGVQQLLQDYVSGYYVLLERHIRVGDRIGFDDKVGTVDDVRLRVTLLHTDDGNLVVVPNSELFAKPVTIFARKTGEAPKPAPPA
jgi:small-conductance mechanosensitive channel